MVFEKYIVEKKIEKKSDILLLITTFNSAAVTRKLLELLRLQKNIKFDILIIDNASGDYIELKREFPEINYVLLGKNVGACGSTSLGIHLAQECSYEFFIISDNDSQIIGEDSLSRMLERLKSGAAEAVIPKYIEIDNEVSSDRFLSRPCRYHYFFARTSMYKKFSPPSPDYFLFIDDLAITAKALTMSNVLVCGDVFYYHAWFKPKDYENTAAYFNLRNSLIFIVKERDIDLKYKLLRLAEFLYVILMSILAALRFWDYTYLQTIFLAINDWNCACAEIDLKKIPKNKFVLEEIDGAAAANPRVVGCFRHLFGKHFYANSNYLSKKTFYQLVKNAK